MTISEQMYQAFFERDVNDNVIPDKIESAVHTLNRKGYKVKYSSPGYVNTRFTNDHNKDGVINNKLAGTARVIFARDYHFTNSPRGWVWKTLENGSKALYAKPLTYNEKQGTKKEAYNKWRDYYINQLNSWANSLPQAGSKDHADEEDKNFNQ